MNIRWLFVGALALGLMAGGAVSVCRLTGDDGDAPRATPVSLTTQSPRGTAESFAAAWSAGDVASLYLLLDPASQQANPLAAFQDAYDRFNAAVRRTSLSAKVDSVADTQAALSVHLATAYFGEIEYTTTLTLLRDGDRWLVSWQASAIHPDLVNGQVFKGTVEKPKRGTIFDRAKKPLAITRDVRMLGLNRGAVKDRAAVSTALVTLGATQEQIDAAFNNTGGPNQRIAVAPLAEAKTEAALAAASTLPGLLVYFDTQRVHPLGAAAAHVVGYTRELTRDELKTAGAGFAVGDRTGATGLEAAYDRQLAGRTGLDLRLMDSSGTTVRTLVTRAFVEGQDVATTLDAPTLETANARLAGRAGAAVVLDPRTNALLALNSSPSFDPDAFERNDAAALQAITKAAGKPQTNRATQGLYSAGSTFKLITGAAGLASGFFGPNDRLACGATWAGVDPPRKNWEGAQGPLTIAEGLMRSCNPVFYEIALTLYNRTDGALSKMARAFGFGAPTGIDVLAEEKGLVPDAQWKRSTRNEQWFPGDEVNLGIGQGDLLVTPLQLVNAYSAIIAGQLRTPVVTAGQAAVNRGALPLTVDQVAYLRGGLKLVTGPNGTANSVFWNAGYTDFAGKSGTAEDVGTQQHVLFVAYSPAAAPRAVAAVVLDEGQAGSIEAGPIARDIVLAAIR